MRKLFRFIMRTYRLLENLIKAQRIWKRLMLLLKLRKRGLTFGKH